MSSELDKSILEYARFHGLACDHQAIQPVHSLTCLQKSFYQTPPDEVPDHFDSSLEQSILGKTLPSERMFVDADSAKLLASITQSAKIPHHFDEAVDPPTLGWKRLKQELPLLHSDHESDVQELLRRVEPDLRNEFLPLEILNEDADEGFTWPSKHLDLPSRILHSLNVEKLEVSALAMQLVAEAIKQSSLSIADAAFETNEEAEITQEKKVQFDPVTPPLLPMSPEHIPFLPSPEVERLNLLSKLSSPTKEQLREVEQRIFAQDALHTPEKSSELGVQSSESVDPSSDSAGKMFDSFVRMRDSPSSPPDDRPLRNNVKMEVPLVFADPSIQTQLAHQDASVKEKLKEMVLSLPGPPSEFREDEIMNEIDTFFNDEIKPVAEKASRSIEQEQLQEADTTMRVSVPIMDFSPPPAPWNAAKDNPHLDSSAYEDTLPKELKDRHFRDDKWLLRGKVERELQWTPFPAAMGRVDLSEAIQDHGTLDSFLTYPLALPTDSLFGKPLGLRLFDSNGLNEEQEMAEGRFQEGADLQSMIRKRRLEMREDEALEKRQGLEEPDKNFEQGSSDRSLCDRSLENFIWIRKGSIDAKKLRTHQNSPHVSTVQDRADSSSLAQPQGNQPREQNIEDRLKKTLPDLKRSERRFSIVTSAAFLKNRALVRQIQKLLPNIEIIERDWSHHLHTEQVPRDSKNAPSAEFFKYIGGEEADIIMSPGVGLIMTTLQKIRQQALPGRNPKSLLREKIKRIAPRYESLGILITIDSHLSGSDQFTDMTDLSYSDCEAITLFTSFCSNLDCEAQAVVIAGGNEALSRWIATFLVKQSASNAGIQLNQDETLWELFLRRAGVNAFAAQAILSELSQKKMSAVGQGDFGLTAFVKMSAEERLTRFERLLGGRRLLSKVNAILEERW